MKPRRLGKKQEAGEAEKLRQTTSGCSVIPVNETLAYSRKVVSFAMSNIG